MGKVRNNNLAGELLGLIDRVGDGSGSLDLLLSGGGLGLGRCSLLDTSVAGGAGGVSSSSSSVHSLGSSGDNLVEGLVEVGHDV